MHSKSRKIAAIFAAAALALGLSACESKNFLQINEDGTAEITMEYHDPEKLLSMTGMSCSDLEQELGVEADENFGEFSVEDLSTEAEDACKLHATSAESLVDGEALIESEDTFTLNFGESDYNPGLSSDDLAMFESMGQTIDIEFTIIMPGKVIEASSGTIDGNTVKFVGIEEIQEMNGLTIVSEKSGGGSDIVALNSGASAAMPWWIWVLIGIGVLGIIAVVVIVAVAKKKKGASGAVAGVNAGAQYPGQTYAPAQPAWQQPGAAQPGAPAAGAAWGQPAQPGADAWAQPAPQNWQPPAQQ